VWRSGWLARVFASALVALQIVWGGDVYFIPGHAIIRSPVKAAIELIGTGYRKDFKSRARVFGSFADVGALLGKRAKVLVHDHRPHAGLLAMTVNDTVVNQGGISYGRLGSPRAVYDLFKEWGVTHLMWVNRSASGDDSLAGDIVFWDFALRYGVEPKAVGSLTLAKMPTTPPPPGLPQGDVVALLPCGGTYKAGLYHLGEVTVHGTRSGRVPKPFTPRRPARQCRKTS